MRDIPVIGDYDRSDRPRVRRPRRIPAFTLVELMVVIFIISILVALVIGVGKYVYDEAARRETESIQAIVMNAVETFHDIAGIYPPSGPFPGMEPPLDKGGIIGLIYQFKGGTVPGGVDSSNDKVRERIKEACGPIILELPPDVLRASDNNIYDGFGNPMDYDDDGGLGGKPVLISPGADEDINTEEDNLRSDM